MTDRVGQLRHDFDTGFAAALETARPDLVDVLLVRAGGTGYAIALADITGMYSDVRVIAMPTSAPELLGVAAIRSTVVPVYSLERIVVPTSVVAPAASRWLVTVDHLALAFDGFDGYRRLPRLAISAARGALRGTLDTDGETRAVLDIPTLVAALPRRASKDK